MIFGHLAISLAAAFTGAAFYINWAEQPARLKLVPPSALTQWKSAYASGYLMQASLVLAAAFCGFAAFFFDWDWKWLLGAAVILLNWPYTLYIIRPLNDQLTRIEPASATDETRGLIGRWGWMHMARTGLGALGLIIFIWAAQPAAIAASVAP
jgi:hypothetical protein